MTLQYTDHFAKTVCKLCRKNPELKQQLDKQLNLFARNTRHPSLKSHKLTGNRSAQYAI